MSSARDTLLNSEGTYTVNDFFNIAIDGYLHLAGKSSYNPLPKTTIEAALLTLFAGRSKELKKVIRKDTKNLRLSIPTDHESPVDIIGVILSNIIGSSEHPIITLEMFVPNCRRWWNDNAIELVESGFISELFTAEEMLGYRDVWESIPADTVEKLVTLISDKGQYG